MTRLAAMSGYVAVAAVLAAGVLLVVAAMLVRRLLAPRAPLPSKLTTYESGVDPVGEGWAQTKVRYFVFSFLYVVFAVDAVYLFPWALVLRDAQLGRSSLVEMGIFIGVVVLGLAHAARRGLLRWV
jgi:NADH-quinone oxidoreductase subunit A